MKLSTKIILPIILISALLILLAGCFGVPSDESPTITTTGTGTITGIIAAPCCYTLGEPVSGNSGSPEFWCYYCENDWYLQAGVKVILTSGQEVIATTTTDEFGVYTFTDVPPGENYVITAYCPDDDDIPLVKDVALELIEGGSFDAKTTDLVSTSLGLVVDFVVYFAAWDPEDISLDKVIAAKPHFPGFPKFKKLIREVRRVLENCEDVDEDDDLLEALCLAAEEVSESDMGCAPGFTPEPEPEVIGGTSIPDPDPDPTVSISLTKEVNADCYTTIEETLVYTLTVTNTGEVVLTNVTLTDDLPNLNVDIGTLTVGGSWTEVYDYNVPSDQTGTLTNKAEVSGTGNGQTVSATASVSLDACTIPEPLPPTADAGGPYSATLPSGTVVFDGTGSHGNPNTVSIVSYAWTIYDDTMTTVIGTMTGATPSFNFTTSGTYKVSLTVTDNQTPPLSDTDTSPAVVTIHSEPLLPTADAGGPYSATLPSGTVVFNGTGSHGNPNTVSIVSYAWTIYDDTMTTVIGTMTGATPSFNFTTSGTYKVSLTVTDNQTPPLSDTDTSPAVVTIHSEPLLPTADAGGPYSATLPSGTVVFNGTGSHGNPNTVSIVSYAWTIYDDTMTTVIGTMTGATPSFNFTTSGTYKVSLTVTDNQTPPLSDTDTSPAVVTIHSEPLLPTADAGGPYSATLPSGTVVFNGTGSHGNPNTVSIVSYAWTIYDDTMTTVIGTMTGATPSFNFTTSGTYKVSLTVTDNQTPPLSDTDTSPAVVTISPGPLFESGNIVISWAEDKNHGRLKFEDFVLDSTFNGSASDEQAGSAGWRRLIITLDQPYYFGVEPLLLSLTSSDPSDLDPSTIEVVGTQTNFTVDLKIEGIRVGIITMKVQGQTGTFPIIIDENLTNLDDANKNPITFDVQGVEVIVTN